MTNSNLFDNGQKSNFSLQIPNFQNHESDELIIDNLGVINNHNSPSNSTTGNIIGDYQDDIIRGTDENDNLIGTADNDVFAESAGNDTLDGGDGNDELRAGTGDDLLIGGKGVDTMTGGEGADLFRFDVVENQVDIIKDFDLNEGDSIEIMGETLGDSDKVTLHPYGNVFYEGQAVVNIGIQYASIVDDYMLKIPSLEQKPDLVART